MEYELILCNNSPIFYYKLTQFRPSNARQQLSRSLVCASLKSLNKTFKTIQKYAFPYFPVIESFKVDYISYVDRQTAMSISSALSNNNTSTVLFSLFCRDPHIKRDQIRDRAQISMPIHRVPVRMCPINMECTRQDWRKWNLALLWITVIPLNIVINQLYTRVDRATRRSWPNLTIATTLLATRRPMHPLERSMAKAPVETMVPRVRPPMRAASVITRRTTHLSTIKRSLRPDWPSIFRVPIRESEPTQLRRATKTASNRFVCLLIECMCVWCDNVWLCCICIRCVTYVWCVCDVWWQWNISQKCRLFYSTVVWLHGTLSTCHTTGRKWFNPGFGEQHAARQFARQPK